MCPARCVTYVSGRLSVGYRVLHQKPQPTTQRTIYCTIELPTPSAVRYSSCAAGVSYIADILSILKWIQKASG
jgi:hypothetical protein